VKGALGAVVLLAAALGARAAQGQTIIHEQDQFRSPQHWAVELRFGLYAPEIDSEFAGAENPPHQTYFGTKRRLMPQLEVDYQFLHLFGSAAVGVQVGYFREKAKAFDSAGNPSGDTTSLLLVPTAVQFVYRMDEAARRIGIPIAPYGKVGLSYTIWRITDANGETARTEDGKRGRGGTPGWQAAAGVALLLDFIDPASARALDADTGVNHTYLFFEMGRYEASGLGRAKALHVGDTTWFAGLMFEF
jgi:hypothetical protein